MEHIDAVQTSAVEKYLLNELTPDQRDQFEEHYFGCVECADDLRATATFVDLAKSELKTHPAAKPVPDKGRKQSRFFLWTPAFLVPALAALLMVVVYQNIVVFPHMRDEVATLGSAEILPSVSLLGNNSRSGEAHPALAPEGRPFELRVDIPTEDRFTSYTCELLSPSGASVWHVDVSPQQAKDTVAVLVPSVNGPVGNYTLVVRGHLKDSGGSGGDQLARYPFVLQ